MWKESSNAVLQALENPEILVQTPIRKTITVALRKRTSSKKAIGSKAHETERYTNKIETTHLLQLHPSKKALSKATKSPLKRKKRTIKSITILSSLPTGRLKKYPAEWIRFASNDTPLKLLSSGHTRQASAIAPSLRPTATKKFRKG